MSAFVQSLSPLPSFPHHEPLPATYRQHYQLPLGEVVWGTVEVGAEQIFIQYYPHSNRDAKTVLVVHGYLDHSGLWGEWYQELLANGYSVLAFDLPGHGLSTGQRGDIPDFTFYQTALQRVVRATEGYGVHLYASLGHSTGAAILAEAALRDQLTVKHLILVAPLLRSRWWRTSKLGLRFTSSRWSVKRYKTRNSHNEEFYKMRVSDPLWVGRIPLRWTKSMMIWSTRLEKYPAVKQRVAIFQGGADRVVDGVYNVAVYQSLFPNNQLFWYAQAKHHLMFEQLVWRQKVWAKVLAELHAGLSE